MDTDKYVNNIQKSGFFLEFNVADSFKKKGWSVINNKYYIDDLTETVREIDIVAYKTLKVRDVTVFTVLIVSCKKSEDNVWAMLTKDINWSDPNAEWRPMHWWSNHKALSYMLTNTEWRNKYFEIASENSVGCAMCLPEVDIFAFQEMDAGTGKVKNDKAIYNSITSLMKAQAYEFSSLPKRKKNKVIYQFNLLSIIDADLIRLHF